PWLLLLLLVVGLRPHAGVLRADVALVLVDGPAVVVWVLLGRGGVGLPGEAGQREHEGGRRAEDDGADDGVGELGVVHDDGSGTADHGGARSPGQHQHAGVRGSLTHGGPAGLVDRRRGAVSGDRSVVAERGRLVDFVDGGHEAADHVAVGGGGGSLPGRGGGGRLRQ